MISSSMVFQLGLSGPTPGFPSQRIGHGVYGPVAWFKG